MPATLALPALASRATARGAPRRRAATTRASRRGASVRVVAAAAAGASDDDSSERTNAKANAKAKAGAPPKAVNVWERRNVRMWDVDLEAEFERQDKAKRDAAKREEIKAATGLGFASRNMLDDPTVDLSARLRPKKNKKSDGDGDGDGDGGAKKPAYVRVVGGVGPDAPPKLLKGDVDDPGSASSLSAIDLATTKKEKSKYDLDGWNYAPTKAEQKRWQREWEKGEAIQAKKNPVYAKSKFSTAQMRKLRPKDLKPVVPGRELTEAEKAERRRAADDSYERVKQNLLLTTAGLCGSGTVAAFFVGGVPLGSSFAFGSAGALFYVKLLASKAEAGGGGQGGPPSILVPVILFMALNRWNTFFAEDVGLALSPIPMLLGFFTYKPASVFQAFRDVMEEQKDGEGEDEWVVDESR